MSNFFSLFLLSSLVGTSLSSVYARGGTFHSHLTFSVLQLEKKNIYIYERGLTCVFVGSFAFVFEIFYVLSVYTKCNFI